MQKNLDIHLKHRTPRILRFFRKSDVDVFTDTMQTSKTVEQGTSADQGNDALTPRNAVKFLKAGDLEVIHDVQQEITDPDVQRQDDPSEMVMLGYQHGLISTNFSISSKNSNKNNSKEEETLLEDEFLRTQ